MWPNVNSIDIYLTESKKFQHSIHKVLQWPEGTGPTPDAIAFTFAASLATILGNASNTTDSLY